MRNRCIAATIVFAAVLLSGSELARAQETDDTSLLCVDGAPEPCEAPAAGADTEPDAGAEAETSAGSDTELKVGADTELSAVSAAPGRSLPGFLLALHLGPFFSLGGLVGGGAEIDFQFKLHRNSYLSIVTGYLGGYQIARERNDSLLSGTLAYRHYFPLRGKSAATLMGGPSLGYYFTGPQDGETGYDWLHVGLKTLAAFHWFLSDRNSIGAGAGLSVAFQFSEFRETAEDFLILIPEARFSATF